MPSPPPPRAWLIPVMVWGFPSAASEREIHFLAGSMRGAGVWRQGWKCALRLLRAGVDLSTRAHSLGRASIHSTNRQFACNALKVCALRRGSPSWFHCRPDSPAAKQRRNDRFLLGISAIRDLSRKTSLKGHPLLQQRSECKRQSRMVHSSA
jgi:hypothetical protein